MPVKTVQILKKMVTKICINQHVPIVKKQSENRTTDRRVTAQNTAKRFCQVSYIHWEIMVVAGGGVMSVHDRSLRPCSATGFVQFCAFFSQRVYYYQDNCSVRQWNIPFLKKSLTLTYSSRSVIW